jgi:hypothetical protein
VRREGEVGPAGALPPELSLATLCALLATGVEPVPVSLDVDSIDAVVGRSVEEDTVDEAAVDSPVEEDTVDEAVNASPEERASLPVDEAAAVLATPVTLPAVSIARYVGNA